MSVLLGLHCMRGIEACVCSVGGWLAVERGAHARDETGGCTGVCWFFLFRGLNCGKSWCFHSAQHMGASGQTVRGGQLKAGVSHFTAQHHKSAFWHKHAPTAWGISNFTWPQQARLCATAAAGILLSGSAWCSFALPHSAQQSLEALNRFWQSKEAVMHVIHLSQPGPARLAKGQSRWDTQTS